MMVFDARGSVQTMPPFTCSKKTNVPTGRLSFWKWIMQESRTPRGNFAYKKRLIIVFSKICRAICNCEGGGFPKEKHALVTCSKKKNVPTGRFSFWNGSFVATLVSRAKCGFLCARSPRGRGICLRSARP